MRLEANEEMEILSLTTIWRTGTGMFDNPDVDPLAVVTFFDASLQAAMDRSGWSCRKVTQVLRLAGSQ